MCAHLHSTSLCYIVQAVSSSLWQVSVWENSKENMHAFLVKWFSSWREARQGTHNIPASLHDLFHLLVRAEFSQLSVLWCSVRPNGPSAGIPWDTVQQQRTSCWHGDSQLYSENRISRVFQLASVCFVCNPKCFLSSLSICTLQMFADSYHIISPSPHPHPGLLAKLYIFSSFNLSS